MHVFATGELRVSHGSPSRVVQVIPASKLHAIFSGSGEGKKEGAAENEGEEEEVGPLLVLGATLIDGDRDTVGAKLGDTEGNNEELG